MARLGYWAIVWLLVSPLIVTAATPEEEARRRADEEVLRKAGMRTDGAGLLELFRQRTPSAAELAQMTKLAGLLRTGKPPERTKAADDLGKLGYKALPILQAAAAESDAETVRLAKQYLARIDLAKESRALPAAGSLLRQHKPGGAAAVVFAFLPALHDPAAEEELFTTIAVLGGGNKPDKFLVDAVTAKDVRQRAAAAWALGRSTRPEDRDRAAKLMRDESPMVRYRAAEALVAGNDKRGVPGLIEALTLAPEVANRAEATLVQLAGEHAPEEALDDGDELPKTRQPAWQAWFKARGEALDLAKIDRSRSLRGLRLVVSGGVWEFGPNHKTRWHLKDLGGLLDARILPGGRLLVADFTGKRITERDKQGKVLWEYATGSDGPVEVQRMPGGNTLITTASEISEVTPDKKVVYSQKVNPNDEFFSGQKLPGGNILYGLASGAVVEVVPRGREVMRFKIEAPTAATNIEFLKEGRYLIPYQRSDRIVEVDRGGKVQREIRVSAPGTVALLPGGNLLVGSHKAKSVRELDAQGKVLWEHKGDAFVYRVRSR